MEQLATRKTQEPQGRNESIVMSNYNYTETKRVPARYPNACSNINPVLLNKYIADPSPHSDTGYQGYIVGRVYNALKRCASTVAENPTHDELIYMVVDVIARYSSMPWSKTRAGRGRKANSYQTACLHCAECTERIQDIDRDLKPDSDSCQHPITISYGDKASKPLPHGIKSWLLGLIDQCYNDTYVRGRAWLASDERPAAIKYLKNFRDVPKVQSLRPLDLTASLHVDNDHQPEMLRYAEALLNGIINQQDLEIALTATAGAAATFKPDGTKCHNNGQRVKVYPATVAKIWGLKAEDVTDLLERLQRIGKGLSVDDLAGLRDARPPVNPLPAKPRSVPAPTPAPTAEELEWLAAVDQWKELQRIKARSERSAPAPLWQQLGMVDPDLLTQQIDQKQRQLDSWLTQLQDV